MKTEAQALQAKKVPRAGARGAPQVARATHLMHVFPLACLTACMPDRLCAQSMPKVTPAI